MRDLINLEYIDDPGTSINSPKRIKLQNLTEEENKLPLRELKYNDGDEIFDKT